MRAISLLTSACPPQAGRQTVTPLATLLHRYRGKTSILTVLRRHAMHKLIKRTTKKFLLLAVVAASISLAAVAAYASTVYYRGTDQYGNTYWVSCGSSAGNSSWTCPRKAALARTQRTPEQTHFVLTRGTIIDKVIATRTRSRIVFESPFFLTDSSDVISRTPNCCPRSAGRSLKKMAALFHARRWRQDDGERKLCDGLYCFRF